VHFIDDPPPSVISVCRESRAATREQYTKVEYEHYGTKTLLINFDIDTVMLSCTAYLTKFGCYHTLWTEIEFLIDEYDQVQHLAIMAPRMNGARQSWRCIHWDDIAKTSCKSVKIVLGGNLRVEGLVDVRHSKKLTPGEDDIIAVVTDSLREAREQGLRDDFEITFVKMGTRCR
jgi:hypothetical protein